MLDLTPRQLTYLSIAMGIFVLLATVAMLLFPKQLTKRDCFFFRKSKDQNWKLQIARFINNAIMPLKVSLFYLIVGLFLLWLKEYRILGIGSFSLLIGVLAFWSLKRITQRPRPQEALIKFSDFSFPSGHTTASFTFLLSLALSLAWIFGASFREGLFLLAFVGGGIVARSRRYLKVHWLSDVLIGALLGSGCFLFSYLLFFYFGDALIQAVEQVFFSL